MNELGYFMYGIGFSIIALGVFYLLYQLGRYYKSYADLEEHYNLMEIAFLVKKGKEKGINLEKEKYRLSTLNKIPKRKTFRRKLEAEIISEFFDTNYQVSLPDHKEEGKEGA